MDGKTGETGKVKRIQIIACSSKGSYCSAARKLFVPPNLGNHGERGRTSSKATGTNPSSCTTLVTYP
eukprot:6122439-Heterocapsa_arctica.AAC.1